MTQSEPALGPPEPGGEIGLVVDDALVIAGPPKRAVDDVGGVVCRRRRPVRCAAGLEEVEGSGIEPLALSGGAGGGLMGT